ncbi:TPA: hypothetical protein EYP37_07455 [Candidatus Poribacteria bacterium]|nr:hypothetical protein [Candidatus Poribacteria bacterium]
MKKIGRWRWSYLLTPQGMAEKARLTRAYIQQSMQLYRETREEARRLLQKVKRAGYDRVQIEGDAKNDLVDVCRLTCLEQGVEVVNPVRGKEQKDKVPVLHVDGRTLSLKPPEREADAGSQMQTR